MENLKGNLNYSLHSEMGLNVVETLGVAKVEFGMLIFKYKDSDGIVHRGIPLDQIRSFVISFEDKE